MSDRARLLKSIYRKLDQLPIHFGMPAMEDIPDASMAGTVERYIGGDLDDTLREIHMTSTSDITEMSEDELRVENRTVYHILRRFRNSASVDFKYSTGSDGRTVDKTQIPGMISEIMSEYDAEFRRWRSNAMSKQGSTWTRASTVNIGKDGTAALTNPTSGS